MDATLQRHVIPVFHYALKSDGFLVLGQAETDAGFAEHLTKPVDFDQLLAALDRLSSALAPPVSAPPRNRGR